MSQTHTLLELRVARSNTITPEAAAQLFAALPQLYNNWWDHLLGRFESLSFEIHVQNQTIFLICYCPNRLSGYIASTLSASYPEILITPTEHDVTKTFVSAQEDTVSSNTAGARIRLKNQAYLPLKTYQAFGTTDALLPLFSTLSQLKQQEVLVLQYIVSQENQAWKNSIDLATHPQRTSITEKVQHQSLAASIRLGVRADSSERCNLLLDAVGHALQTVTHSEGNSLQLQKMRIFPKSFFGKLHSRHTNWREKQHFSLLELATLYHLPNSYMAGIMNIAWGKRLLGEAPENLPIITGEMQPNDKREINCFARALHKNAETVYGLRRSDRRRHLYVIGKTGTGKSTLLANMAINDLKNNEGICVIDPHGDLIDILLDYIPSHRINDTIIFDPSDPERTVKLNLFEGNNVVHRELIASGIVSVFKKLYAYSWGPRLEYILRNALLTLLKAETARLSDIVDMLTDASFRARIVSTLDDPILKNFWINEFDPMQEKLRTEAIAPILNKVGQFVSSPLVRDVVNARKSSFSIEEAMDTGKIILVNLSQGKLGEDNATLLGAMLITKIQLAAMARVHIPEAQRRDFYLYVDEFQNFATESFTKILSEARKYRLNLILANQYSAQIPEDVQKAIFGNCGSIVSFVLGASDAGLFSQEFGGHYSPEDLVSLNRHQIINKLSIDNQITEPFPAVTLPLAKSTNSNKEKVLRTSAERYARKK